MTEDDVRKIVLSMKGCLDPSHIACEKCEPGFDERMRKYWREERERMLRESGVPPGFE